MLLTFSAFDLTQRNVLTPDPCDVRFRVQTGEIGSRGIELEGKASLSNNLDLLASYTFNSVRVNSSNNPAEKGHMPIVTLKQMASAWVNYQIPDGLLQGLGMGAGVRYVGKTYADVSNTIENKASLMFDASLYYQLKQWQLMINATNLLNKQTIVCRNNQRNCRYGLQREIIASASYRW